MREPTLIHVIETIFGTTASDDQKRYYTFVLPLPLGAGYRHVMSFNAFFRGVSGRNMTERRLFVARTPDELTRGDQESIHDPQACQDIFDFYRVIGYDHRKRRYTTGERIPKPNVIP